MTTWSKPLTMWMTMITIMMTTILHDHSWFSGNSSCSLFTLAFSLHHDNKRNLRIISHPFKNTASFCTSSCSPKIPQQELLGMMQLFKTTSNDPSSNTMEPNAITLDSLIKETASATKTTTTHRRLQNAVCVVTGASRGIGKAIALELGKDGATVYVTGTSSRDNKSNKNNVNNNDNNDHTNNNDKLGSLPGTVEDTADMVTELGGCGIAVICDHANDEQVRNLFRLIQQHHGRIDLLVNNCFQIPSSSNNAGDDNDHDDATARLVQKFWYDTDAKLWDTQHTVGLRSHYVASGCAVPIMIQQQHRPTSTAVRYPLIVMIGSFGGICYTFNVAYGVAKAGVDRLVKDMAVELEEENISVISLWPGVVMTERNRRAIDTGDWQRHVRLPLQYVESPSLTGKVIIELALDKIENRKKRSGTFQVVTELAQEYNIVEDHGKPPPPSIRSLRFLLPAYAFPSSDDIDNDGKHSSSSVPWRVPEWLIPDWKLPFWIMAQGRPKDKNNQN